jgi:hypothetical protein
MSNELKQMDDVKTKSNGEQLNNPYEIYKLIGLKRHMMILVHHVSHYNAYKKLQPMAFENMLYDAMVDSGILFTPDIALIIYTIYAAETLNVKETLTASVIYHKDSLEKLIPNVNTFNSEFVQLLKDYKHRRPGTESIIHKVYYNSEVIDVIEEHERPDIICSAVVSDIKQYITNKKINNYIRI